ncbi:MAG: helix-turn-helix domain-containing protein, partial [Lentisphaerae bacterium]
YLENLRLDRGRQYLLETDMMVADIARELGYSSSSFFCRRFRHRYGLSPNRYRRQHS